MHGFHCYGPKEPCITRGPHSPREGAILRGKGRPIVRYRDTLRSSVQKRLNWDSVSVMDSDGHRKHVLDGSPDHVCEGAILGERTCPTTLCHELCKNGWTDRDAVWVVDSVGLKEAQVQLYSPGGAPPPMCPHWRAHLRIRLNRSSAAITITATINSVIMLLVLFCSQHASVHLYESDTDKYSDKQKSFSHRGKRMRHFGFWSFSYVC